MRYTVVQHKQAGDAPHGPSSVKRVPDPYQREASAGFLLLFGDDNLNTLPCMSKKRLKSDISMQVYTRVLVEWHKVYRERQHPGHMGGYYEVFVRLPRRRDSGAS
ncbi:hypothetical protein GE21DRAFT_4923 [Neurospora crassa]|uniref:Uncharacterized protein n=1 Tax=Neurospora crassa (strain ATCC 24698 / 74-OR23-1A / CBS 708.71 / DSM 1257 / FGSC 987) TaxID=367110 RepID=Q7S1Z8_NEUCR|nr:hypothetical protein NCU07555 [Neurospora crassa OR74A]EAA29364.1 hypothetical protein NCU07555 [Neurospora crassa OR74A]KHE81698.1 hypothetical protein GE21DRAFT_4923 [Neurospora crassa]|eukprot:XP_958600.1 hypothetical protein NCU07555 [Neurospora crassa OR74A]